MNAYKVSYAAVWVSGQHRSTKEGLLCVVADTGTAAGRIARANVPDSPDEITIGHVLEVAKNVIIQGGA